MALNLLGTREQKENEAGNMGTRAVFSGNTEIEKTLLGNKGALGKFSWEQSKHGSPLGAEALNGSVVTPHWGTYKPRL